MEAYGQFENNLQEMIAIGVLAITVWLLMRGVMLLFTRRD